MKMDGVPIQVVAELTVMGGSGFTVTNVVSVAEQLFASTTVSV
jgi:hypothetical protein